MRRYVKATKEIDIKYLKNRDEYPLVIDIDFIDTKSMIFNKRRYKGIGINVFKAIVSDLDIASSEIFDIDTSDSATIEDIASDIGAANGTGRDVIIKMWDPTSGIVYLDRQANNGAIETIQV